MGSGQPLIRPFLVCIILIVSPNAMLFEDIF